MIAHRLIEYARAAGCSIEIEDGDLVVEADCDPPADLIASLRQHKAELITFLDSTETGHSMPTRTLPLASALADPEVWRDLYEERAAHRQYDGGYPRLEAEALTWAEAQLRWHAQHGERVPKDICAGCRRPIGAAAALDLIDGSRVHLHDANDCLIRHDERWRARATRALMALGLRPPVTCTEDGIR
jgi:hypothetical protein